MTGIVFHGKSNPFSSFSSVSWAKSFMETNSMGLPVNSYFPRKQGTPFLFIITILFIYSLSQIDSSSLKFEPFKEALISTKSMGQEYNVYSVMKFGTLIMSQARNRTINFKTYQKESGTINLRQRVYIFLFPSFWGVGVLDYVVDGKYCKQAPPKALTPKKKFITNRDSKWNPLSLLNI